MSTDIDLLGYAKMARAVGWSSIPIKEDKKPNISEIVSLRDKLPSDRLLDQFFGDSRKQNTIALALVIDSKITFDTDVVGEEVFITKIMPRLSEGLKEKIKKSAITKSSSGRHYLAKTGGGNYKLDTKEYT